MRRPEDANIVMVDSMSDLLKVGSPLMAVMYAPRSFRFHEEIEDAEDFGRTSETKPRRRLEHSVMMSPAVGWEQVTVNDVFFVIVNGDWENDI